MFLKLIFSSELAITHVTIKRSQPCMFDLVLIEISSVTKFLLAEIARVFKDFVMSIFFVFLQVFSVFRYMTAHIADALRVHFNLH